MLLAGNPAYYNRFGFIPTIRHGIKCSVEIPENLLENIMVCELYPQALFSSDDLLHLKKSLNLGLLNSCFERKIVVVAMKQCV